MAISHFFAIMSLPGPLYNRVPDPLGTTALRPNAYRQPRAQKATKLRRDSQGDLALPSLVRAQVQTLTRLRCRPLILVLHHNGFRLYLAMVWETLQVQIISFILFISFLKSIFKKKHICLR